MSTTKKETDEKKTDEKTEPTAPPNDGVEGMKRAMRPRNNDGLYLDGPTFEEFVAAGEKPDKYPPKGYAARPSSGWDAFRANAHAPIYRERTFEQTAGGIQVDHPTLLMGCTCGHVIDPGVVDPLSRAVMYSQHTEAAKK